MKTSSVHGRSSVLEPAVLAAVDLDQLAVVLASQARLMEGAPLLAKTAQAVGGPSTGAGLSTNSQGHASQSRISVASVGPKSAYRVLTSSTAYLRMPAFRLRLDVLPRALWISCATAAVFNTSSAAGTSAAH